MKPKPKKLTENANFFKTFSYGAKINQKQLNVVALAC